MDSNSLNTDKDIEIPVVSDHPEKTGWFYLLPVFVTIFFGISFLQISQAKNIYTETALNQDQTKKKKHEINFAALLANDEFSRNLRDTVYTDQDLWLELRIDQQTLYVHYRDGSVIKYPVSTGIPGASKSVESRAGLFAIFLKEEVHLSTQFSNARMNYYMPYNMGIGFHGLPGTGYYGNLGIRPSSHGCIRMRNEDVKKLFGQCKIGTLVLSHKGRSARTVAFAPEGFKNGTEYTKDDYMKLMAYNLGSVLEGRYFINPPRRLVLDGTIIPKSGITVSSTEIIPDKQHIPEAVAEQELISDYFSVRTVGFSLLDKETEAKFLAGLEISEDDENVNPFLSTIEVDPDKVKKYSHNPLGILPYFGPKK